MSAGSQAPPGWKKFDGEPKTRRCGCAGPPRRRCDLCDPARSIFLGCSAACIDRHRREQHADSTADGQERAQRAAVLLNQKRHGREPFAHHRARLGRLLSAAQRAEGICVLGAGNCDDLDLPALVRDFSDVHLVDLDDVAPAQAVAQLPETLQKRITLHGGLDLSGVLARIDRWGDLTPGSADLMSFVAETSAAIAARIGRTFDVVLSACLLSQLYLPIRESLVLNLGDWQRLCGAVDRAHLATVAALTRSGGTGVLALDTTHSHKLPELAAFTAPETWGDLETAVDAAMARRGVSLDPDPKRLIEMLQAGDFQPAVERPRVSGTWVWDSGGGVYALIKALLFQRA